MRQVERKERSRMKEREQEKERESERVNTARSDPPRQALCLRMAYRVLYPNQPAHIPFLLIILPNLPDPKVNI